MSPTNALPRRVPLGEVPTKSIAADGKTRVAYLVTHQGHGSDVLLAAEWVEPGAQEVAWQAGPDVHETYYVVRGRLRISWDEGTASAGSAELGPDDAFYFPPGRLYRLSNVSSEEAFVVWTMLPPLA